MGNIWWSLFLVGILLLAGVVTVFLFQPGFAADTANYITLDTERRETGLHTGFAKTAVTLNDQESLSLFPREISDWKVYGNSTAQEAQVEKTLGADVFIMRTYRQSLNDWPLYMTIVYAPTLSSLHPPEICYTAGGYNIDSHITSLLTITDSNVVSRMDDWSPSSVKEWFSSVTGGKVSHQIPVNRLVVSMKKGETISERILSYHVYLKDTDPLTESYTTLRVSTPIPSDGEYGRFEAELQAFMDAVVSNLLVPAVFENDRVMTVIIKQLGVAGYAIVAAGILAPLVMILYPVLARKLTIKLKR